MASVHGMHFTAFATEYKATLRQAQRITSGFPPLLRDLAESLFPQLCEGTFVQIAALLPYWVANLLDELQGPDEIPAMSGPEQTETLALANLFGWWSYLIQDWLLDRELEQPRLLPLGIAFYATAVWLFERLLPGDEPFWEAFEALSLACAEAHCWEQRCHFQTLADLDAVQDLDNLDRLADRSAPLRLSVVAQCSLRGYDRDDTLCMALQEMVRYYAIGRQIADDRTDWADDLRNGRLNYVSARLIDRMKETDVIQSCAELDVERMMGYFLHDDKLFADIQRVALAACQRAAESIAAYNPLYLSALVAELTEQTENTYRSALASRCTLRELFSSQPDPL